MSLLEANIRDLGAVAGVPAQSRSAEPARLVDQEQHQLERVRKAHEVKLGGRSECHGRVPRVEGAAESGIRRALRGHEQMFAPAVRNFQALDLDLLELG
jgi:hypothetical protein